MLHKNLASEPGEPVAGIGHHVAIGDIIRSPLDGDQGCVALVIDIETINGWRVLTIAPAVRDVSQPVRPGTLRLTRLDEVRQSGLTRSARFELDRRISIAPASGFRRR